MHEAVQELKLCKSSNSIEVFQLLVPAMILFLDFLPFIHLVAVEHLGYCTPGST